MGAILDLKVTIAAARGCSDLQFRRGAHLVDTDKTSGGDSEKLTRAIIESEVISTFEGRRTGRVLELHRYFGVCALEPCALVL